MADADWKQYTTGDSAQKGGSGDDWQQYTADPAPEPARPRAEMEAEFRGTFGEPKPRTLDISPVTAMRRPAAIPTLDRWADRTQGTISAPAPIKPTVGSYARGLGQGLKAGAINAQHGLTNMALDRVPLLPGETQTMRAREIASGIKAGEIANMDAALAKPAFESQFASDLYDAASSAVQSAPAMVAGVAAGYATGNPVIGTNVSLGLMGAQTSGQAYNKYRGRGATPNEALLGAGLEGGIEVATEKLPMGVIVEKFGRAGAKKWLAEFLVKEMAGEQVATFTQDAVDTAIANPNKTWGEFAAERPNAAYQTALAVLVQSGAVGGASKVVEGIGSYLPKQDAPSIYEPGVVADAFNPASGIDATGRIAARNPADTRAPAPGIAEQAIAAAAQPTPEDIASPLDTNDIVGGKVEIAKGQASTLASEALTQANLPPVGSRVSITLPGGAVQQGTMTDYFSGEDGDGVHITLDNGKSFREYFDTINDTGTQIAAQDPQAETVAAAMAEAQAVVDEVMPATQDWQQYTETPAPLEAATAAAPAQGAGVTPAPKASGSTIDAYMTKVRGAESGGNDAAKNPKSSATGRYQFTNGTWIATYRAVYGQTGESEADILAKRGDGTVQDKLMRRLTEDNAKGLASAGFEATAGNLYLAHFAGIGGARKILAADPNAPIEGVLGQEAVNANPFLKGKTAAEVAQWAAGKMGQAGAAPVSVTGAETATATDTPLPTTDYGEASASTPGAEVGMPTKRTGDEAQAETERWRRPDGTDTALDFDTTERDERVAIMRSAGVDSTMLAGGPKANGATPFNDLPEPVRARIHAYLGGTAPAATTPTVPVAPAGETSATSAQTSARVEETASGRGIAVIGATPAQLAAIAAAVPQAKPSPPRADGAITYSKKYETEIRTALDKAQVGTGETKSGDWQAFPEKSGTLGIPRADMPQIKAEHRGAMVNFFNARGIQHSEVTVPASSLKPTQLEYSPQKALQAANYEGGDRAILISRDNHVVDGHHQWLAAGTKGEDVRAIKLDAPIRDVLAAAHEFPSSTTADGATEVKPEPAQEAAPPSRANEIRDQLVEAKARGIEVGEPRMTTKQELQESGGTFTAVATRQTPFKSERGFGNTAGEAQADAIRRIEKGEAGRQAKIGAKPNGTAPEPTLADGTPLAEAAKVARERVRTVGRKKINGNPTLIEWIADRGGIWDGEGAGGNFKGGDLKAMGLGDWHNKVPFRRKAIRDPKLGHGGRGIDNTLTDAIDAGFFPELQGLEQDRYDQLFDTQILLDAIDAELAGKPRYSTYGATKDAGDTARTPDEGELEAYAEWIGEVARRQFGVENEDLSPALLARAAQIKFDAPEGLTDADAFMRAVNERAEAVREEAFARDKGKRYEFNDYDWPYNSENPAEGFSDGGDLAGQAAAGAAADRGGQARPDNAGDRGEAGSVAPKPAKAAKSENIHVRTGQQYRFTKQVEYLGGNPDHTYTVESATKKYAYFRNDQDGGRSSLNTYRIGRALDDGSLVRVRADAAEPPAPTLDAGAATDPNRADLLNQQAQLGAAAPLQGASKTGQAQDGTMGLPMFDAVDQPQMDLAAPAKPAPRDVKAPIGKNSQGFPVYEDENGVRSYSENGIRITEPVGMRPTRAGMELSVDRENREKRFLTAEEAAAKAVYADKAQSTLGGREDDTYTAADLDGLTKGLADTIARTDNDPKAQETILDAIDRGLIRDGDMLMMGNPRWALERGYADIGPVDGTRRGRITDKGRAKLAELRGEAPTNQDTQPQNTATPAPETAPESKPDQKTDNAKFAKNTLFTADKVAAAKARMREKMNRLNSGIDPELFTDGMTIAGAYIEAGIRNFAEFAKAMREDFGNNITPYLLSFWEGARNYPGLDTSGMTSPDVTAAMHQMMLADAPTEAAPQPQESETATAPAERPAPTETGSTPLDALVDYFSNGGSFPSIVVARVFVAERSGGKIKAGTADAKRADELIEAAVVQAARKIAAKGMSTVDTYRALVDLYERQPNLAVRSSTSVEQQAYSTPVPLAYLASQRAGITQNTTVYEPTAGNGALLIDARATYVTANEMNPDRAAMLRQLYRGAKITQGDAMQSNLEPNTFDRLIANPPFGAVKDEDGDTVTFALGGGYETGEIDHAIALTALEKMRDGGRAALIVGSVNKLARDPKARSDAYNGKAKREFYYRLYSEYNVTDHFTVAGELYAKQGAGWPVDVIVIEGRGKSKLPLPAVSPPRQYASWGELESALDRRTGIQSEAGAANGRADNVVGRPDRSDGRDSDGGRAGRPDRYGQLSEQSQPGEVRAGVVDGQPGSERLDERAAGISAGLYAGSAENNGNRATGRPAQVTAAPIDGENARQVTYNPASSSKSLDTLVPVNMQTAITAALNKLQDAVGKVDDFVADRLGYDRSEIADYFSAEQVDALALALDNMDKGAGFIIGDQTGIGKGRVVAGVIRYAIKSGRMPIFVTEKPNLYADMYRDMADIGLPKMLGRPVNILMTNAGETVPLDEDGKQTLKTPGPSAHNARLLQVANGERDDVDVVFTNYSQMQTVKGETTPRQSALAALAPGSIVIFDESHNAGGQGNTDQQRKTKKQKAAEEAGAAPMNRAQFARSMAAAAHGVFFSSATYAKRPDVMDLYASTDMKLAVANIDNLATAITKGGIPMQQVVASMLTEAGQYVRRERSFDGVDYNTPTIDVDRTAYAQFAEVLRAIQQFQEQHIAEAIEAISDDVKSEAQSISHDGSIGNAGATSTNFTSVMHNLVEQMLVALKAEPAVARAIEAIKRGEKPVITLANTMGSFIQQYAEDNDLSNGGEMPADFRAMLSRYLDRTRHYTIKQPFSKEKGIKKYISDNELSSDALAAYAAVEAQIARMKLQDVPISPIDHIRNRLADAGYTVGEITGRTHTIDYSGGMARLRIRPGAEKSIAGKLKAMSGFNNGTIDVMILNQSGSTGLSLHASEKFKDQRPRRMIIAQAERNIDTHMQMLGRIHRTGQVVLPAYDQLVANVPAEMRPAAVLAKKMASLNANTTGARGSAMTGEGVPDFINIYGDEIAARMMEEDPVLHKALLKPLSTSKGSDEGLNREDAARKVTGKLSLMPLTEQEAFYETFLSEYRTYLAEKEAAGEAALEAKTLDLDAKPVESAQVIAPTQADSPFGSAVNREVLNVKRLGKPMTPAQVLAEVAKTIGEPAPESADITALLSIEPKGKAWVREVYRSRMAEFDAYRREVLDGLDADKIAAHTDRLNANQHAFGQLTDILYPGGRVAFTTPAGFEFHGIVTSLEKKGSTKNPIALGSWRAQIALTDPARTMTIPLSQLRTDRMPESPVQSDISFATHDGLTPILQAFEEMQNESREDRTIFTGNMLAAFEHTAGKGQIVNFVSNDGSVRPGIMMRRGYNYAKEIARQPVPFRTPEQVIAWVERGEIAFADGVKVERDGSQLVVTAAASKAAGGRYFLNAAVRQALGGDFYKKSTGMVATTSMRDAAPVIAALQRAGAILTAKTNLEAAREIVGTTAGMPKESRPADRVGNAAPATGSIDAVRADLEKQLRALGLEGKVALRVANSLFRPGKLNGPQGTYWPGRRIIEVALDATDSHSFVLNHEAVHALIDMGAISKTDKMILAKHARGNAEIWGSVSRRYMSYTFEQREEEAIADLFAVHAQDSSGLTGTVIRIIAKTVRFFAAVRNALRGQGFTTPRTVFEVLEDIRTGRAAQREGQFESGTAYQAAAFGRRGQAASVAEGDEVSFSIPEREQLVDLAGSDPTWKGQMAERFDRWRTRMQDRYLPLLKVQSEIEQAIGKTLPARMNPYLGEELMTGRIGARLDVLADDHVEPLLNAMHAEKVTADELETYLYARHAPERNARIAEINPEMEGNGSGMTDLEAAAVMRRIERAGQMEAMERLAVRVDAIRDMALAQRVESGLLSKEQAEEWRATYEHYVPLRGFAETDGNVADSRFAERINRSGGGINVRGRESKPAFGRRSKADSPIAYLILQAEEAIVRGETNRVAQRFINLARAAPDDAFWKVNKVTARQRINEETGLVEGYLARNLLAEDKDWTVSAKFNGKEVRVTMNRQNPAAARLADSMKNLTQHQLDWITEHLGKVNRFLSSVNTSYNPEFVITNAIRDLQTAVINLAGVDVKGIEASVLKSYPAALKASMAGAFGKESGEWGDVYREFTMAGGRVYFNRVEDVGQIKQRIEKLAAQAGAKSNGDNLLRAKMLFVQAGKFIENTNLGIENAVRLATFKAAREAGLSADRAASLAKNVTVNFNRRGTFGPAMNAAYLFYNAGMQGTARIAQAVRSPRVRKMLAGVMVTGFLVELMNSMVAGDDDDGESFYDKISPMDKERNLILAIGGSKFIKLPMPYGYNVVWNAGRTAAEIMRRGGDRWQESSGHFLSSMLDAFNPVGGSSGILNFFSPTILDPIVDLSQNRNFMDRPIMPDQNPFDTPTPDNQRYFGEGPTVWKPVTDFLNVATGGDSVVPGAVDVSPATLEYLSGVVAGAAGSFVMRAIDIYPKAMSDEGLGFNDIPFARKVIGDKPGWYDKSAYYDRTKQVQQAESYAKDYAQGGQMDKAQAFVDHNAKVLSMLPASKIAQRQMSELRKAKSANVQALESGAIDRATYRDNRSKINAAEKVVVTRFNTGWNAAINGTDSAGE